MHINGIGNICDRTYATYHVSKYKQPFAETLEQADDSLNAKVENEEEKEEMPDEEETRTEIVVRPDGSKVLMITVTVGSQEAVTSVELAKPTKEDIPSKDISGDVDINDTTEILEEKVDYDERGFQADSDSVQWCGFD